MKIEIDVEEFTRAFECWFKDWVVHQRIRQRGDEIKELRREILVVAPPVGTAFSIEGLIQDLTLSTGKEPSPTIVQDALASLQRYGVVAPTTQGYWYMTGQ